MHYVFQIKTYMLYMLNKTQKSINNKYIYNIIITLIIKYTPIILNQE